MPLPLQFSVNHASEQHTVRKVKYCALTRNRGILIARVEAEQIIEQLLARSVATKAELDDGANLEQIVVEGSRYNGGNRNSLRLRER